MTNVSEKYRSRAIVSEGYAREATDPAVRDAWAEIAIEWHALANRVAEESTASSKSSMKPNSSVAVMS